MRKMIWALACLCASAEADEHAGLTEADFLGDQPMVLTVTWLAQPQRQAPAMVTLIDREMIEASGFTEITDLFRLIPGFQVTASAGWRPTVTYHGLSDDFSRRMQVLVDGRSIYNPGFGQVNWRELPLALEDIERIEVVHGPNAAAYGTNAFFAVINIVTRHASDESGLYGVVSQGNRDMARYGLRYAGSQGDLDYRITVDDRQDNLLAGKPNRSHDRFVQGRFDYGLKPGDDLSVQFGLSQSEWETGEYGSATVPPHDSDNWAGFFQLQWQRRLASGDEFLLRYYHERNALTDEWIALGVLPVDLNYQARRDNLEVQYSSAVSDILRWVAGTELRRDDVRSPSFFSRTDHLADELYRLFGSLEWRPGPRWLVNIGTSVEHHYFVGTRVSPRVSLHFLPSSKHAFRLGVTRGYRSPTYLEEKGNWGVPGDQFRIPAINFGPESTVSTELGYVGDFPRLGMRINARLFHDHLRDLVDDEFPKPVVAPGDTVLRAVNHLNARIWGGEYQLQWRPDAYSRVILSQSVAWVEGNDPIDVEQAVPKHTLGLLAMRGFAGGIKGSLGYYWVSDLKWQGDGNLIKQHDRVDMRLAKQWKSGGNRFEAAVVGQALDGPTFEYEQPFTFERRAFATIRVWH
jgi:outer membrane receptor for ferrienterochelin and colicin